MKVRKGTGQTGEEDSRVDRGPGRRARRRTGAAVASATGTLAEEDLLALMDAQFPNSPRRRGKDRKKAGAKKLGTTARKRAGATRKAATSGKTGTSRKTGKARKSKKADTEALVQDAGSALEEDFVALRALAEASGVAEQAEALWCDEVLGLLDQVAEQLSADVAEATAGYAEAPATHAGTAPAEMAKPPENEESKPAFLQLLADDLDDEDPPLEVFDADALSDEIGDWGTPRRATAATDRVEWDSMVTYLATRRQAARKLRAARRLQKRAAATAAEFTPGSRTAREMAAGPLLAVGVLLLGWAATYYLRTGDLRIALGMLAWASCTGCALALFQQRAV